MMEVDDLDDWRRISILKPSVIPGILLAVGVGLGSVMARSCTESGLGSLDVGAGVAVCAVPVDESLERIPVVVPVWPALLFVAALVVVIAFSGAWPRAQRSPIAAMVGCGVILAAAPALSVLVARRRCAPAAAARTSDAGGAAIVPVADQLGWNVGCAVGHDSEWAGAVVLGLVLAVVATGPAVWHARTQLTAEDDRAVSGRPRKLVVVLLVAMVGSAALAAVRRVRVPACEELGMVRWYSDLTAQVCVPANASDPLMSPVMTSQPGALLLATFVLGAGAAVVAARRRR